MRAGQLRGIKCSIHNKMKRYKRRVKGQAKMNGRPIRSGEVIQIQTAATQAIIRDNESRLCEM